MKFRYMCSFASETIGSGMHFNTRQKSFFDKHPSNMNGWNHLKSTSIFLKLNKTA